MLLIYTKNKTERLHHICSHIFAHILKIEFELCTDIDYFLHFEGYKLNYSDEIFENILTLFPHKLLFENDIHEQEIEFSSCEDTPICFLSSPLKESALPFDVFAACFFFLSRYEEYLPHTTDVHGRYEAVNSVAYQRHFLHLAAVDRWIQLLADVLQKKYPEMLFPERKFSFLPTYDVDLGYAYKHKGYLLNAAGFVRDLLRGNTKAVKKRAMVLLGKTPDPYETFDYLTSLHQKHHLKACYFFLTAKNRSLYDKNTSPKSKSFQKLIQKLSEKSDIGLHTSYYVRDYPQRIDFEKTCLQTITKKIVHKNRHHYLRFSLPKSYQLLVSKGITEEYSMGYVHHIGFRAGTCNSFYWFDLQKNKTTSMLIFPLLFMENALLKEDAWQVVDRLVPFIDEIKKHNGT
ncbi:MAG: hypothetical protein LBH82_00110, partial [Bacteroidales bacterium]|nr:hypothetical protein [Bacteroidales bacterium]